MGVSEFSDFEFLDMEWSECERCGCVQLSKLVELEKLYRVPHNPAVGRTWESHNSEFANLVKSHSPQFVLDLGGANLKLANLISPSDSVARYDVIDFSAEKYEVASVDDKINLIVGSIENYSRSNLVDCVILSHTLEHLYEPVETLVSLRECLAENGKIFVSVPNIKSQLRDGFLNALHFEHTYFIDHEYVKMIGSRAGLKLVERVDFSSYNSFYVFERSQAIPCEHSSPAEASQTFVEFVANLQEDVRKIVSKIDNEDFYVFGAHVFSQYLVNAGLPTDRIISIIDNDDNKAGKFLYGTSLPVKKPSDISSVDEPLVLLRVAQYEQEIREQLLSINGRVRFL
jgi:SAM-dependent methyltransferase